MHLERVSFDAKLREETRKRKKYNVQIWDGKEVIVGVSE